MTSTTCPSFARSTVANNNRAAISPSNNTTINYARNDSIRATEDPLMPYRIILDRIRNDGIKSFNVNTLKNLVQVHLCKDPTPAVSLRLMNRITLSYEGRKLNADRLRDICKDTLKNSPDVKSRVGAGKVEVYGSPSGVPLVAKMPCTKETILINERSNSICRQKTETSHQSAETFEDNSETLALSSDVVSDLEFVFESICSETYEGNPVFVYADYLILLNDLKLNVQEAQIGGRLHQIVQTHRRNVETKDGKLCVGVDFANFCQSLVDLCAIVNVEITDLIHDICKLKPITTRDDASYESIRNINSDIASKDVDIVETQEPENVEVNVVDKRIEQQPVEKLTNVAYETQGCPSPEIQRDSKFLRKLLKSSKLSEEQKSKLERKLARQLVREAAAR